MTNSARPDSAGGASGRKPFGWPEAAGLLGLAGLVVLMLAASWRRWPDPQIDFGVELYLPWRLAKGAVLYRDADIFYGPLSQYVNAALFRLFGPGMMVLVAANLLVFAAILAMSYVLFRRAWGAGAALASSAVFVAVFGFSQFVRAGNYNYATPYAHEATHGILLLLLLVGALVRWNERATAKWGFVAGGLLGLTMLLKPEILVAAALVTCSALGIQWRLRRLPSAAALAAWAVGALLPTAGFTTFFSFYFPLNEAVKASCWAWWSVASSTRFSGVPIQALFAGLDHPLPHLANHLISTLLAVLIVGGIGAGSRAVDWAGSLSARILLFGLVAGAAGWLALAGIDWIQCGSCLLGLTLIYIASAAIPLLKARGPSADSPQRTLRVLVAVLAAALMARMLLNGRIYQYGFYQAAVAGMLIPAVLIGEFPERLQARKWGEALAVVASLALAGIGAYKLATESHKLLRSKVFPVGEGRDRFYTFTPKQDPTGEVVERVCERLRQLPRAKTLIVLPEGEMINYLTRLPSPVAPFYFFASATEGGLEEEIVSKLQQRPPDAIVFISRDLSGYGVRRYGERPGEGQQILRWASENYSVDSSVGGDPFDYRMAGAKILIRRN